MDFSPSTELNEIINRIDSVNISTPPFVCETCWKEFPRRPLYLMHLEKCNSKKPTYSKYGKKLSKISSKPKSHEYEHKLNRKICGRGFVQVKNIQTHLHEYEAPGTVDAKKTCLQIKENQMETELIPKSSYGSQKEKTNQKKSYGLICKKVFCNRGSFRLHMKKHKYKKIDCFTWNKPLYRPCLEHLLLHVSKRFSINKIRILFFLEEIFASHLHLHHSIDGSLKKWLTKICKYCRLMELEIAHLKKQIKNKGLQNFGRVKRRLHTHNKKCQFCNDGLKFSRGMNKRKRNRHKLKIYKCRRQITYPLPRRYFY